MKRLFFLLLASACSTRGSAVPSALRDLESGAEDAYDEALVGDTAAVSADADTLAARWDAYRPKAAADGARASDLSAMDAAVSALSDAAAAGDLGPAALARVANGVSAPMDELFGLYDDPIPAPILALDHGGREVSLDSLEEKLDQAAQDLDELDAVWASVRERVVSAGGSAEADAYDASLAKQRELATAGNAAGLRTESDQGLELVDALERVFER